MVETATVPPPPSGAPSSVGQARCPACYRAFTCDACLHQHLVEVHAVRYSQVFGPPADPEADLCTAHGATVGSLLGL